MASIKVRASDLAAITGMNPYRKPEEVMAAMQSKQLGIGKPCKLRSACEHPVVCTLLEKFSQEGEDAESTMRRVGMAFATNKQNKEAAAIKEAIQQAQTLMGEKDDDQCMAALVAVKDQLERLACVNMGTMHEEKDLDRAQEQIGNIAERNAQLFSKIICKSDGIDVKLVGMVDGRDSDGNVVEAKHRRNRLFGRVPEYERVQVMAYMFLTDTTRARLVESYGNKTLAHNIDWNDTLWHKIIGKVAEFATVFIRVQDDEEMMAATLRYKQHPNTCSAPRYFDAVPVVKDDNNDIENIE